MEFARAMTDVSDFEERRQKTIWQTIDELGSECAGGHKRLRGRIEQLEHHVDDLDTGQKLLIASVKALTDAPVEATKIRFSTGVMVSIVAVTISLVGTAIGIGNRVTNRIDALATDMARQAEDDKKDRANIAKIYDERNGRYEKSLDSLARQIELLKYEQQRLREDVTKKNGSTR